MLPNPTGAGAAAAHVSGEVDVLRKTISEHEELIRRMAGEMDSAERSQREAEGRLEVALRYVALMHVYPKEQHEHENYCDNLRFR